MSLINPIVGSSQFTQYWQPGPGTGPGETGGYATFDILPNKNLKPLNPWIIELNNHPIPFSEIAAATYWKAPATSSTNMTGKTLAARATAVAASSLGSAFGVPGVSQIAGSVLSAAANDGLVSTYATLPFYKRNKFLGKYGDFRTQIDFDFDIYVGGGGFGASSISRIRLDGASSALRGGNPAYAAATAIPGGVYTVFNLNAGGTRGYGWGDHGNPHALRKDFTERSHVATRWNVGNKQFEPTKNALERVTPFRGDRVNVIDFGKRTIKQAYVWNPAAFELGAELFDTNITQDFIKFFFTGPSATNNSIGKQTADDIIVFRAIINSLSDSHRPNWTPQYFIGRADPNYTYTGYTRDVTLSFTIFATSRDEMKPIYRKLNALAGYTAPKYIPNSIVMQAPWMRITIGDLFQQTPVVLSSLDYTFHDSDTTWEINIEQDPTMKQTPHKITVQCGFSVITETLPQKGGRFYGLSRYYDQAGQAVPGNGNWLSDFEDNFSGLTEAEIREAIKEDRKKAREAARPVNKATIKQ